MRSTQLKSPNTSVEPLKQNQFGGSIGGPVRRDKTFFFGFYEGFRNRQGDSFVSTVPSLAERQGDFSAMCTEGIDPITGFCTNPAHQLFNVFFQQPYPFNQVPAPNQANPLAQSAFSVSLLTLFPKPDVGTNGFLSTGTLRDDRNQFGLRLDHYLTSTDTLNFRYMFNNVNRSRSALAGRSKYSGLSRRRRPPRAEFCRAGDAHLFALADRCCPHSHF